MDHNKSADTMSISLPIMMFWWSVKLLSALALSIVCVCGII